MGYKLTRFHDIDSDEIITTEQLREEYHVMLEAGNIDPATTFPEYAFNCMTINGGTLEEYHTNDGEEV